MIRYRKYFRTWFIIDFVTSIPFGFVASFVEGDDTVNYEYFKLLRIFRLLRIMKMLRFLKTLRLFDELAKQWLPHWIMRIIKTMKILLLMVLSAHFAGCLWWYIGLHPPDLINGNTGSSWIDAVARPDAGDGMTLRTDPAVTVFEQYTFGIH